MCGIFGLVVNNQEFKKNDGEKAIKLLFKLSESRGKEAAGLGLAIKNRISIYKQPMKASILAKSIGFNNFLNSQLFLNKSKALTMPITFIGHTRLATNGSELISENNQPVKTKNIVGVHNGIITNKESLRSLFFERKKDFESDSKFLFELINSFYQKNGYLKESVFNVYKSIKGSASIGFLVNDLPVLVLATNTGSLYYSYKKSEGFFVFASEKSMIDKFLEKEVREKIQPAIQLAPFSAAIINFNKIIPEVFSLKQKPKKKKDKDLFIIQKQKPFKIIDLSSSEKKLRCCTKCVLPETYPFISFDKNGVCNYCRQYKKQKFLGLRALEKILKKYRSKDGSPDCLVGFSGGRDSSYGIHLLKTKLGMHPLVYTYDWGTVTDAGRRNQARICGKLGLEQIVRAADLKQKRRYIRKNIYAWLKKPELGMVPLFMAGDKWFYYYSRQLAKKRGIKLSIQCCGQQVEQMEFKAGFCGVDQTLNNNTKLYQFEAVNKIRLAFWYLGQYITNPAYINESFIDSIMSFYTTFLSKDNTILLYQYLLWDERKIEKVLKKEYRWEAEEKYGTNAWRMDDGHTAFINYIWYTVAGFSEYDNFRSNQIREGMITRKKALQLIKKDNKPRFEMLHWFSQVIGFNLEEVLLKINSIPKLYSEA